MIVTKKEYEKMPVQNGGDLWNQNKLCRMVFKKHPDAVSFEYHIGTGLWVDVIVNKENGEMIKDRIYDN